VGDWSPASGYDAARSLLANNEVTAIFAANDQMAAGVVRAAEDLGRRVPEDLSVVGYDDLDLAPFFAPPLTSVSQNLEMVGRRCLEYLLAEVEGEPEMSPSRNASRLVHPELVIRDSTAPPSARLADPTP
jgi:DNA-binding LacI/PurR family transcriptional regulator